MDYINLQIKKEYYNENKHLIPDNVLKNYEDAFIVEYTHNSTAIEGNTLSLMETKLLLEDNISVGGKSLREIYESVNHKKAYDYILKRIADKNVISETIVKDIHSIILENIFIGGIYRNVDVYISGALHTPPSPVEAYKQIKNFYVQLPAKRVGYNAIEYAAWTHAEFVRVHPFIDGNGRTARLLMNYQLMDAKYLPISISKENKSEYFELLEEFSCNGNLNKFVDYIAELEDKKLNQYISAINQIQETDQNIAM